MRKRSTLSFALASRKRECIPYMHASQAYYETVNVPRPLSVLGGNFEIIPVKLIG